MPRELKEIRNFNQGTMLNASERDIPDNAAAFSLNVNPLAEAGILGAISNDKLFFASNNNFSSLFFPLSWGATISMGTSGHWPSSGFITYTDNIYAFNEKVSSPVSFIGTQGQVENALFQDIYPYQERVKVSATLNATFTIAELTTSTKSLTYLSYSNNNTDGAGNVVVSHFVDGEATLEFDSTSPSTLADQTFALITADGKSVTYKLKNASGTSGTVVGDNTEIYIQGESTYDGITDEVVIAIHASDTAPLGGHDGRITAVQSDKDGTNDLITLTDNHNIMSNHIEEDDYIMLVAAGGAYTNETNEIIKITNDDTLTRTFTLQRGCFGTPIKTLAAGDYDLFANKITIDGTQIKSTRGIFDWVGSSQGTRAGNHIGGNSSYLSASSNKAYGGTFACDSSNATIQFIASSKTIVFGTDFDYFPGEEGDVITVYKNTTAENASELNYGYSSKILKKDFSNGGTLTMETAPDDLTCTAGTIYFECNLIKNHTFHHKESTAYQTVGTSGETYKLNDWTHKSFYLSTSSAICINLWGFSTYTDDTLVTIDTDGGGYWETSPDMLLENAVADNAEKVYPHEANDRFVKLIQDYLIAGGNVLAETVVATDTILIFASNQGQVMAKNDVLKFSTSADKTDNVEYMKVLSVDGTKVSVSRGHYNTTPRGWAHGDAQQQVPHKGVNSAISQSISKDRLKGGQQYIISFYAQDNDCAGMDDGDAANNSAYGGLSLTINGGYINSDGKWTEASSDYKNGYANDIKYPMQEDRWIEFQDLVKSNNDIAVDSSDVSTSNGLDGIWRKFHRTITLPSKLTTDLDIEIGSRGKDASYIYIDQIDLRENTTIVIQDKSSLLSIAGNLDNSGIKDLVFWDSISNKLGFIPDVYKDSYSMPLAESSITTSNFTSTDLTASSPTFTANNREIHIGLGSNSDDSFPQWLGYVNHKVFGVDYSNEVYQDEDTIHKYGAESAGALSKICVAGEHEYLAATWDNGTATLDITHTAHGMNVGDNIVVREWADASNSWPGAGVWVVTSLGGDLNSIVCKRYTTLDANPPDATGNFLQIDSSDNDRDQNTGKICYRPYYYYGIRDGDYHVYRITPSDRIADDAASLDTANYPAGTVERSTPMRAPLSSICTCHAKNPGSDINALTGGQVYAMSNVTGDIYVINIEEKYNEWTTAILSDSIIRTEFRSFKWSNDHISGDIGGTTGVYAGLAEESSPIIKPSGIMSDILETKGPTATFIHNTEAVAAYDANNGNSPNDFDTRLWIQFRPGGEDTFGEGARYLFCGKTETGNTDGEDTIAFAERTPPMNVLFGRYTRMTGLSWGLVSVTGLTEGPSWQHNHPHGNFPGGDDALNYYAYCKNWINTHHTERYNLEYIGFKNNPTGYGSYYDYNLGLFAYVNFGWNIGWQGVGGNFPAVKVAKYGLCPMADNDKDGIIDGTGVIVPSTVSIQAGNPFGNLHQRISAHSVGLIGGSERPWWSYGGKVLSDLNYWSGGGSTYINNNEPYADAPWDTTVDKCLFICTDMHFGDHFSTHGEDNGYMLYDDVTDGAPIEAWGTTGGSTLSTFQISGTLASSTLQAGDVVYVQDGAGENYDKSGVITKIVGNNITLDIDKAFNAADADTGYIQIHTNKFGGYSNSSTNANHGPPQENHTFFHFSYDINDPNNGEIFTEGPACGHYGRKWFTPPCMLGGRFAFLPGIRNPIERLNYRSGFLIRPFDTSEKTFEDLVVGNLTAIDIPSSPDAIYHVKSGNKLHYNLSTSSTANNFATRMYISSSANLIDESNKTKLYICDLNLNYPSVGNYVTGNDHSGEGGSSDTYNTMDGWDIYAAGTLSTSPYIIANTTANEIVTVTADRDMSSNTGFWTASANCEYQSDDDEWDIDIDSGVADDNEDILTNATLLSPGTKYTVVYEVNNYVSGSVRARLGSFAGTSRTSDGTYSELIESNGTSFKLETTTASSAAQDFSIDNISIKYDILNAEHFPLVKLVAGTDNVTFGAHNFQNRSSTESVPVINATYDKSSPAGKTNGFAGMCISIIDQTDATVQTRYIVGSETNGTNDDSDLYLKIHWPFARTPLSGDKWYLSHHGNICTAPIRLLKEITLSHDLGSIYTKDPTLDAPIYKGTGITTNLDSSSTTATLESTTIHHLTTGDTVEISGATYFDYDGIYTITVTSPTVFTFTTVGSGLTDDTNATWTVVNNTESAAVNPIKTSIANPNLKTFFGGLDMRKLRGAAVSAIADENDDIRLESTDHRLSVGDTITHKSDSTAAQDGTYIVKLGDTAMPSATSDKFDVENTTSTNTAGDWTTNQWESIITERGSTARIGEIRSGFNAWDVGNIAGNALRYDTDDDASSFYNITSSGVEIKAVSVGGVTGDSFLANTKYEYKISFIYDGYQEGPLSDSSWSFEDTVTRGNLSITIKIQDYSRRLTHVCIYRRDTSSDFYKLVEEMQTVGGWTFDGTSYSKNIEDGGAVGATYSARTGMSEILDTIKLKYGISTEIDGYLFAGNCSHPKIENASNMIFRSRPGMFSIFDYVNDFLSIKSKPTAMTNFNGRLYVFDSTNIYKINPHSLVIEDVYEGIGCLNKDCVIVTEYGMFFADKNGAYMHNGSIPTKISEAITLGGSTSVSFGGTDNVKDLSWDSIVTRVDNPNVSVSFLPKMNSVLFSVEYLDKEDGLSNISGSLSRKEVYVWSYNLTQERWDLWEISKGNDIGKPFVGTNGRLFIPIGESVYEFLGGTSKRELTWISKKLSMDQDSTTKVFNKIKINGLSDNLDLDGDNKESSQRLIVHTNTGEIATANITYSSDSSDHSTYRLSGTNRKGRWIQFKLEDMTKNVDSIGILFRKRGPK